MERGSRSSQGCRKGRRCSGKHRPTRRQAPDGRNNRMIELEAIEKTYTSGDVVTPVLKDVSFRVEPGQYVAIMGASGTGKSTLMHILGCLDKPTAGHYRLDDFDS